MFDNAEIIHRYTRAQAIEDEILRDYTELAREQGFTFPFAIAVHAWNEAVYWPPEEGHGQSEKGRAWDVITMAHFAIASANLRKTNVHRIEFTLSRLVQGSDDPTPRPIVLAIHCGPGDEGEPVLTVMAPADE